MVAYRTEGSGLNPENEKEEGVEPFGMAQKIDHIFKEFQEKHEKENKVKKFKLPFMMKLGSKGKVKQGCCLVLLIKENLKGEFMFIPVKHGFIRVAKNDTYHKFKVDCLLSWKKYPLMVITEWNMMPFDPNLNYELALKQGSTTDVQKNIINLTKLAVAGEFKKKIGGKMILFIAIAGVAVLYFLSEIIGKGG